jgi:hypothetical protein
LCDYILDEFEVLWTHIHTYEVQCSPAEAGNRYHRILHSRDRGIVEQHEELPGFESSSSNKNIIQDFVSLRNNIVNNLQSLVQYASNLAIFDRIYNVTAFMQQKMCLFIENKLHSLFFIPGGRTLKLAPHVGDNLNDFISGCLTLQQLLCAVNATSQGFYYGQHRSTVKNVSPFDFSYWLRDLLFRECADIIHVSPPG